MKKIVIFILILVVFSSIILASCTKQKVEFDEDASNVGEEVSMNGLTFKIISLIDSTGSDIVKPPKGKIFCMVKLSIVNNSGQKIVFGMNNFSISIDGVKSESIKDKVKFIFEQIYEDISLENSEEIEGKLVFLSPVKYSKRVMEVKSPTSDEIIKFNIVESK